MKSYVLWDAEDELMMKKGFDRGDNPYQPFSDSRRSRYLRFDEKPRFVWTPMFFGPLQTLGGG